VTSFYTHDIFTSVFVLVQYASRRVFIVSLEFPIRLHVYSVCVSLVYVQLVLFVPSTDKQ